LLELIGHSADIEEGHGGVTRVAIRKIIVDEARK